MAKVLRSSEGKKKRKKRLLVSVITFFVFLVAFVGGLSWLSTLPSLSITEVAVRGSEGLPQKEIRAKTLGMLSGKYYYLFSRANAFLYPKKILTRKLTQEYPRAENFSLSLDGLNTLVVEVEERKGEYLWCGTEAPSNIPPSKCLFLDTSGFAFDESPVFSGDAYLAFYGGGLPNEGRASSTSIVAFDVGERFLDPQEFQALFRFVDEAKKLGVTPVKIFIGKEHYAEMHMKEGWKLLFHPDMDFQRFSENFLAIARAEEWKEAVKGERMKEGKLQYLDFRFGNKVYYRFEK